MYDFLYYQWILGNVTEEKLYTQVKKGRITEEEYQKIISSPKC